MKQPPDTHSPSSGSGASGAVVAALVIVPLVIIFGCGSLCAGLAFYFANHSPVAMQTIQNATSSLPVPVTAPLAQQPVNDWWTTRMLAPVYPAALDAVTSHPEVIERLGDAIEPLEQPGKPDEYYRRQDDGPPNPDGETILFDLKGSKGQAKVSVLAKSPQAANSPAVGMETYRAAEITVTFSDGSKLSVPAPKEQAGTEIR